MNYIKYLKKPHSKYVSVAQYETETGDVVHTNSAFEENCKRVFDLGNSRRKPSQYLRGNFPTPPPTPVADWDLHLLGKNACKIPLTEYNLKNLKVFLGGGKGRLHTNRGIISCSNLIANTMGLREILAQPLDKSYLLFNGW
jgi:hypothetical protein